MAATDLGTMTGAILTSNGKPIPFTSSYFAELKVTDPVVEADEMRARFAADGYVLLRGLVPTDSVLDLREAYLRQFDRSLCKDGDARRGAFSGNMPELPPHGFKGHPAYDFVRTDKFRAFADQPIFKILAEAFLGGPAERIRRTPLRHFVPGRQVASRAHVDRTYMDGVPTDTVTIWVPLGDSPLVAGSLVYLEESHQDSDLEQKVREAAPMDRANDNRPLTHDLKWIADQTGRRWLSADYKAGDVVVHSPTIVHASTDPGNTDYMRVSTDIRFLRKGSPADPRWNDDWAADDGY